MLAEGKDRRVEGNAEYKIVQAEGYAQGASEKLKGNTRNTVGCAIENKQMEVERNAGRVKQEARMEAYFINDHVF
ncbi:hypothetical protein K7432_007719 [Basidiobolus ranarum]|uniref:Uncharacterized protein n=1 Tax=Basidiobolus ranarum TaxID=34480 RepID=A0ABR2W053_9FUNG